MQLRSFGVKWKIPTQIFFLQSSHNEVSSLRILWKPWTVGRHSWRKKIFGGNFSTKNFYDEIFFSKNFSSVNFSLHPKTSQLHLTSSERTAASRWRAVRSEAFACRQRLQSTQQVNSQLINKRFVLLELTESSSVEYTRQCNYDLCHSSLGKLLSIVGGAFA